MKMESRLTQEFDGELLLEGRHGELGEEGSWSAGKDELTRALRSVLDRDESPQ